MISGAFWFHMFRAKRYLSKVRLVPRMSGPEDMLWDVYLNVLFLIAATVTLFFLLGSFDLKASITSQVSVDLRTIAQIESSDYSPLENHIAQLLLVQGIESKRSQSTKGVLCLAKGVTVRNQILQGGIVSVVSGMLLGDGLPCLFGELVNGI